LGTFRKRREKDSAETSFWAVTDHGKRKQKRLNRNVKGKVTVRRGEGRGQRWNVAKHDQRSSHREAGEGGNLKSVAL